MSKWSKKKSRDEDGGDMPGARAVSKVSKCRSFAFYGKSGSGKTTLSSTFPGPVILLDIKDEGTDSIADIKDLKVREIETVDDMEDAFHWLKKDKAKRYKTVVIDTCTQWVQLIISEIIGDTGRGGKKAGDWGSMTKQDWGAVTGRMKEWIVNYRDLTKEGYQVVFIAQDRVFNMNDDEVPLDNQIDPEVGPALPKSVAQVLNASVSVIGNTFIRSRIIKKEVAGKKKKIEKIEYGLRLGPNSVYTTKVRKPKNIEAPHAIFDPSFEDILEVILGK